ncbi:GrpB family protein [Tessaracoccus sp. HDW20]|nr:GrpB family protein [Tessaracoccus coleopterorum]
MADQLRDEGFDLEGALPHHAWLGFPSRDDRRYVIHVVEYGSWQRRIDFRDLLRRDPGARARYLEVKLASAEASANWDEYTQSKTDVVAGLLART